MKLDWFAALAVAVCLIIGIVGVFGMHLKGVELILFMALLTLIGVAAAAVIIYFRKKPKEGAAKDAAPATAAGSDTEIDVLVREADRRLAQANAGATIANLPLIFVIGDQSTAKTSTMVNSGVEPELLAGHVYQDNVIAPTRTANLWFARGTALVEAGGAILGDPANWLKLVKRLQPGKLKSLGGGRQSPRAVLLCVSLEAFTQQGGADAVATAGRYLQARLSEISQTLGISFPVYLLFTKTDRVQFFTDYVRMLTNEEATQVFGATVPIRPAQQGGVYAEDETRRLTLAFNNLFYSLCDKRTVFPPRDNDLQKVCGAYEFPRELRKVRTAMVQFMVDVCRPSQLSASPFLRGFYFSGVRPVVVNDAAPILGGQAQSQRTDAVGVSGATGIFRVGKQAEVIAQQAVAQASAATRKVPQWMFLGHLFNDVIMKDASAMAASGASTKVSALRRGLLIAASSLCFILGLIFLWSYLGNRSLEQNAITAAASIPSAAVKAPALPSLDALQSLESLRQSLHELQRYENVGAPYKLRWGLYAGSDMYPEVRRLYYAKFKALLFGPTQDGLQAFMQKVPATPGPADDYGYAYNTVKGYLLTTSEWKRTSTDKSFETFLGDLLLTRWDAGREAEIGKDRIALAKLQFDYYSQDLSNGNPYPGKGDSDAVERTRAYLARFSGIQRVYQFLLSETAKKGPSTTFNQKFPGTADLVLDSYPVAYAYTKDGSAYMQAQIKAANFGGEKWVLGDYQSQTLDKDAMQKGILDLYQQDYIKQWRTVLKSAKVMPYKSLADASDKLNTFTGSGAPILALLWWTALNTSIDLPGVAPAFRAVMVVEPTPAVQQYVVPPNQPYNNALLKLQATIDQAAKMQGGPDPGAEKATRDDAQAAKQATKQMSASFPVDPDGHVEAIVEDLMLKPILYAEALAKGIGAGDLNAKGAGFCAGFAPIYKKFPFNPATRDEATLQEISDTFRPKDGKLWTFYEASLKTVVQCTATECTAIPNAPVEVNPAFLRFFNQAAKFSRALYTDSPTAPAYHYSLKPAKSELIDAFDFTVNGESSKLAGGAQKSFIWPGSASPNFRLDLSLGGTPIGVQNRDGLWAVFRFFADADRTVANGTSYDFFWSPRQGKDAEPMTFKGKAITYAITVDAVGPAVFNKDFLAGLKCVGTVAK